MEPLQPPLPQTVAVYLLSGAAGGAILGTLLPLYRSILGAYLLGILCLLPVYLGFSWVQDPLEGWMHRLGLAVLTGALVGGPVGVGQWLRDHGRSEAPSWMNNLRYPTWPTVASAWLVAAGLAGLAWQIGTRWAGRWQATVAIPLFIVPLAFAVGITLVAVRRSSMPQ